MWRCELDWTFRALLLWWRIQTRHGSSSSEELVARWRVDKILMKFLWIDFPLSFFLLCLHNIASSSSSCPGFSVALFSLRASCVLLCQRKFQRIGKTPSFDVCGGGKWVKNQKQHTTKRERHDYILHLWRSISSSHRMYVIVYTRYCERCMRMLHIFFHFSLFLIFESTIPSIVQSRWQPHGDSPAHTWWMCALCGDKLSWAHCKMLVLVQVEWFVLFDGDYPGIPISLEHHKHIKCESTHMTMCSGSVDSRSWCWRMKIKVGRSLRLFFKEIEMTPYVESSWSRPLKLCRK